MPDNARATVVAGLFARAVDVGVRCGPGAPAGARRGEGPHRSGQPGVLRACRRDAQGPDQPRSTAGRPWPRWGGWAQRWSSAGGSAPEGPACVLAPGLTAGPYWVDERAQPFRSPVGHAPARRARSTARSPAHARHPAPGALRSGLPASARGTGGPLALRRTRDLLGRARDRDRRAGLPPRVPGHRCRGHRHLHHDLSRLVPGPSRAHPRQGAAVRPVRRGHDRAEHPALLRRRGHGRSAGHGPYADRGPRDTRNAVDPVYRGHGALLVPLEGSPTAGYRGRLSWGSAWARSREREPPGELGSGPWHATPLIGRGLGSAVRSIR